MTRCTPLSMIAMRIELEPKPWLPPHAVCALVSNPVVPTGEPVS
jgi:hypothetical protein